MPSLAAVNLERRPFAGAVELRRLTAREAGASLNEAKRAAERFGAAGSDLRQTCPTLLPCPPR